jgi:molecular chaperone GrpE
MNSTTKSKKNEKTTLEREKSKKTSSTTSEKKVENEKQIIESLEKKSQELSKQIENLKNDKLRLLADLDNQKKSFFKEMKEISETLKYNISKNLIEKILPLFDSYERAIQIGQTYQDPKIKQFLLGFQMTLAESQNEFFKKEGIEEIKIVSHQDNYNRELHIAQQVEENNDYPEGTILQVLKKGYLYQKKVLRLAEVKVSKRKD